MNTKQQKLKTNKVFVSKQKFILTLLFLIVGTMGYGQVISQRVKSRTWTDIRANNVNSIDTIDLDNLFESVMNTKIGNTFFVDIDKEKQILNFAIAKTTLYKSLFFNLKGDISNINTPLFANGWNPRDFNIQPNFNKMIGVSRFYFNNINSNPLSLNNFSNKLSNTPTRNKLTTLFKTTWLNFQPEYSSNAYDYITTKDSNNFLINNSRVNSFNFALSLNHMIQWQNFDSWKHIARIKWRPAYIYSSIGLSSKTITNSNKLDLWDIETKRSYLDSLKNETRSKIDATKAYYGEIKATRNIIINGQLAMGFKNNAFIDIKGNYIISNESNKQWNMQFTIGSIFNNSEEKVKTVTGLYIKYINNWKPIFGITTKVPF